MNWYLKVLKQYADFKTRARRKEYWVFTLFNAIAAIIAMLLDRIFGTTIGQLPYGLFYFVYGLFVFVPSLAVAVRRLHDIGKSGWMVLLSFIPLIGGIWLLILMTQEGNVGTNQYGLDPKAEQA